MERRRLNYTETAGRATASWLSARNSPSRDVMGRERRAASISWPAPDNANREVIWADARGAERDGVGLVEEETRAGGGMPDIVLYRTV